MTTHPDYGAPVYINGVRVADSRKDFAAYWLTCSERMMHKRLTDGWTFEDIFAKYGVFGKAGTPSRTARVLENLEAGCSRVQTHPAIRQGRNTAMDVGNKHQ